MISLRKKISCMLRNTLLPFLITSCMASTLSDDYKHLFHSSVYGHYGDISDSMYFEAILDTESSIADKLTLQDKAVFNLKSSGFVPGSHFSLYMTRIQEKPCFMGNLIANENGELVIEKTLSTLVVVLYGHMLGEETTYTIISDDKSFYMSTSASNNPIRIQGKDNALVIMKIITSKVDLFSLEGHRFNPNEKLHIISNTCEEKKVHQLIANAQGHWMCTVQPNSQGLRGGDGTIIITREDGEILTTKFLWGEKASSFF